MLTDSEYPGRRGEADLRGLVTNCGPPWNGWLQTKLEPEPKSRRRAQTQAPRECRRKRGDPGWGSNPQHPAEKYQMSGISRRRTESDNEGSEQDYQWVSYRGRLYGVGRRFAVLAVEVPPAPPPVFAFGWGVTRPLVSSLAS